MASASDKEEVLPNGDEKSEETEKTNNSEAKRPENANNSKISNNSVTEADDTIIIIDDTDTIIPSVIIDLDNYGGKSKKKRKCPSNKCINYGCESGENLRRAPTFCLNYYRVKVKTTKVQEICQQCYDETMQHYERTANAIANGKYSLEEECNIRDEYVEIDSDEEIVDVSDPERIVDCSLSTEAQLFFMSEGPDIMNTTMHKFDILGHAERAYDYIISKTESLNTDIEELNKLHNKFQTILDTNRNQLYDLFKPTTKDLQPLEIDDDLAANSILPPLPFRREGERRSNRNVSKPASYCELADDSEAVTTEISSIPSSLSQQIINNHVPTAFEIPVLPPAGPLIKPRPVVGEVYYAMRQSVFGAWGRIRLMEITTHTDTHTYMQTTLYRVRFESKTKGLSATKIVNGKHLAYSQPANVKLDVGTRVIAVFSDEATKRELYFTGVIAEPLGALNQFRYLIFFDDGYAQYVPHSKVLLVIESSANVWEDIHPESQKFIKNYLETYPHRPMVKLQPNQVVKTEWNGKWWIARVVSVDVSLVQMYFDADARSEWIYRGSTRLGPLFLEMQMATNRQEKGPHIAKLQQNTRKNLPYVEYTRTPNDIETTPSTLIDDILPVSSAMSTISIQSSGSGPTRAVARKSTTRPAHNIPHTNSGDSSYPNHTVPPTHASNMIPFLPSHNILQPQSKVVYFTPKSIVLPKKYEPHACAAKCLENITLPLSALKGYNPLSKPILCGWHRQICKYKGKKIIQYRAPCARLLRNMSELHQYLLITKSDMSVDMFDFDFWVHCLAEFVLDKSYCSKKDMSNGVENVPIPCVNYIDGSLPDFCKYSTRREPTEGVNLNLNEEFLCGCDCTDDCADRTKCSCWQLTIREARTLNRRIPDDLIGYIYKRLPEPVTTGIYECNKRCKCAATCLNRVVQHPLQLKLQLFKTPNRGWGIRCLNDIPQGAFICIYAGNLLTDKMANEGGVNYGDEYLAELDYIEVVERQKEGYESDATDVEADDDNSVDSLDVSRRSKEIDRDYEIDNDEDVTFFVHTSSRNNLHESTIRTRSRRKDEEKEAKAAKSSNTSNTEQQSPLTKEKEKEQDKNQEIDDIDTVTISDDDENVREPSRFAPSSETHMDEPTLPRFKSVRKMFGEDEFCYIMDAKTTGNIGRFLNHSCCPNVFVQNVFVDTHDLRFPWVAFFAMNYVRAGTELTWNYNYDVGSVPGKIIFCHCGSRECRGRLL